MVVGFSDIYTSTGYQNPAKTAGLRMGDVITSIAGRDTKTNEDVAAALQGLAGCARPRWSMCGTAWRNPCCLPL